MDEERLRKMFKYIAALEEESARATDMIKFLLPLAKAHIEALEGTQLSGKLAMELAEILKED